MQFGSCKPGTLPNCKFGTPDNVYVKSSVLKLFWNRQRRMDEKTKRTVKDAAGKLTGAKRREFMARVTSERFGGNARKAEREMGWGRETVKKGLRELQTGIACLDNYQGRGNKKTEEKNPRLEEDIRALAEPRTQADPDLRTSLAYTKITAAAVRKALIDKKGYRDEELPTENTVGNILNRLGYSLKRVQKTKPVKKIPEVNEIFENVAEANRQSDEDPESLRISVDSKAKVNIGGFSRNGKSRKQEAEKASDHDMNPDMKLIPFGILDVLSGALMIIFGMSSETGDFIADCIEFRRNENKAVYSHIKELAVNLDNGPASAGGRTRFIRRITEFADKTGLRIRLVYYPPYHSKYNPIERRWGILEEHWNGEVLNTVGKTISRAKTMTRKGIRPAVHFCEKIYEKGIRLTKKEMKPYNERIRRSERLPKWDVIIEPVYG